MSRHSVLLICFWLLGAHSAVVLRAQVPQDAFTGGQRLADETIRSLQAPEGVDVLENKPPLGAIIAEGDSWFAYPGLDVLGALEGQTLENRVYYRVYSAASAGDTVESMAYNSDQLKGFAREFRKVVDAGRQKEVRAILLSGGGNDIAGTEFHVLLNHARAGAGSILDTALADAFVDRIGRSVESLIGTAARFTTEILGMPSVPVVIHGYAPPVPDGRPYGIGGPLPGPWLQPGFSTKAYPTRELADLEAHTKVLADLISRFNKRLSEIPMKFKGRVDVRYVDVTILLSNVVSGNVYRDDWSNELHPTDAGFKRVADAIHRAIQSK